MTFARYTPPTTTIHLLNNVHIIVGLLIPGSNTICSTHHAHIHPLRISFGLLASPNQSLCTPCRLTTHLLVLIVSCFIPFLYIVVNIFFGIILLIHVFSFKTLLFFIFPLCMKNNPKIMILRF